MIQKLWQGVSLEAFNNWHPLTGKIERTPEKYIEIWPDVKDWFETFALRAQNDINAYLNFILYKFPFESYKDEQIKETLRDMVFVCAEHWVFNRTPIEFNSDASMTFNNGQTQLNSFSIPTINIWDLAPSRMKILANLTQLKDLFDSYADEEIDPTLIDLNEFYTKTEVNALLDEKQNIKDDSLATEAKEVVPAINEVKSLIPDVSGFENKDEHKKDIDNLQTQINTKANKNFVDEELTKKQNKLIPNGNIEITNDNKIRAFDASFDNDKFLKNYSLYDSNDGDAPSASDGVINTAGATYKWYQQKKDDSLATEAKEVVPAINEINSRVPDRNLFYTKTETDNLLAKKQDKLGQWIPFGTRKTDTEWNTKFIRGNKYRVMWSGDATYGSKVKTIFTYNYTGSYGIQASQYGQSGDQWNSKLITLTYFDPALFTFEFQKGSSGQLGKIWSVEEWQEPEITNLI